MPRPRNPLLSRRNVAAATLEIMERDGPDAVSVRKIAERLGVNAASLYHHFKSKDDILNAAARTALAEIEVRELREGEDWIDWLSRVALEHRRFLIARPYMIPLMVQRIVPRTTLPAGLAANALLTSAGVVGDEERAYIFDTLEGFVVGSAMMISTSDPRAVLAVRSRTRDQLDGDEATFVQMVQLLINGLLELFRPPSTPIHAVGT